MMVSNRNLLFQGLIFRFYVKLRGSISNGKCYFPNSIFQGGYVGFAEHIICKVPNTSRENIWTPQICLYQIPSIRRYS